VIGKKYMSNQSPRLSVGLAVYNGENYLHEAIDSILNQTFQDFELIISDNASTDRTQAICQEYAAKDDRIRYYRNEVNRGATWNLNRVMSLATGEYFKLAAHDDACMPEFLAKCVAVLDHDPSVVLCHTWTRTINQFGEVLEDQRDGNLNVDLPRYQQWWRRALNPIIGDGQTRSDSPKPYVRFRSMVATGHSCYQAFGVVRTQALRKTGFYGNYSHADGVMLSKLALMGKLHTVPEYLFLNRKHPEQSMTVYKKKQGRYDYQAYALWWDPANAGKILLPTWKMLSEYCQAIWNAQVSVFDKAWCYFDMLRWMRWAGASLVGEVVMACRQLLLFPSQAKNQKSA
jgi:glycosyltransferase involved in cell wall biosynthesis